MYLLCSSSQTARWLLLSSAITVIAGCGGSSDSGGAMGATPTPIPSQTPTPDPTPVPTVEPTTEPGTEPADDKTVALNCGAVAGGIDNNRLDVSAKSYLLCKHNETRSQIALGQFMGLYGNFAVATDMKRLQWDSKLETVAQHWADQCQWQHNSNRTTEYNALAPTEINGNSASGTISVGENLAYFASSNLMAATMDYAVRGYDAWVNEGHDYSIGAFNNSDYCANEPCGHFTQVIWANSYKVGCAVNYCASGLGSTQLPATLLVCNYASAGNYIGQLPYAAGSIPDDVCATADPGQGVCRNGLTESANYNDGLP